MNDGVGRRAILVVHGDEGRRELLVAHLRRRYGVDYTEITDGRGHGRLDSTCATAGPGRSRPSPRPRSSS